MVAEADHPMDTLLSRCGVAEIDALDAASRFYDCPYLQLNRYQPDHAVLNLLSEEQSRKLKALPLFRVGDQLFIAVEDPGNLQIQDHVAQLTGLLVQPVLATHAAIQDGLNRHLLSEEESGRALQAITAEVETINEHLDEKVQEDPEAPNVKLVDHIISQAIRLGASDLHLEPFPTQVLLRYRIDGVLREFPAPPRSTFLAVVSRIKIKSGLDIAERRRPQDGRSSVVVDGKKYDLRISIIPNLHGEGIVIRILNAEAIALDLNKLGFDPDVLTRYKKVLTRPHGVILVTGPTGSGKSTTLYATLTAISDVSKKLITLEDPVEYQLAGVTQIQVQPEIGYTFAQGLKAILRHDPDTVLVGEIRDLESAQIAIRAALTGHQMFSTLHTNNAPQAITRLTDMGVPFYQLQAALNGILAQRLVRRLCPRCKEPATLSGAALEPWRSEGLDERTPVFQPKGCSECNGFGFKGRLAVHELLDITRSVRRLAPDQAIDEVIAATAAAEGAYLPLKRSLGLKIRAGLTSPEEALGLVGED